MSDIKMSDVFIGNVTDKGNSLTDDTGVVFLEGFKWAVLAAKKAINNHDKLTSRVAEFEALLVRSIDRLNDCIAQDDAQAYKEAEKFIDIARNALKESE